MVSLPPNLRAALECAGLGWRVFPVADDGRSPLIEKGCHAASADRGQLESWWGRWPRANLSLACGPASGVLALDIDAKGTVDGFARLTELEGEFGPLPPTVTSRTPSGGAHYLFAYPIGHKPANRVGIKRYASNGDRTVYAGLDVRGDGGSICLPPSRKPSGAYAWERCPQFHDLAPLPGWLLDLMLSEPPPREPVKITRLSESPDRLVRYVCAAIEGECGELARMAPGSGRNQKLYIAAARLGSLVGAELLGEDVAEDALERAATDCGLVAEDGLRAVRLTIANGLKRGIADPRGVAA